MNKINKILFKIFFKVIFNDLYDINLILVNQILLIKLLINFKTRIIVMNKLIIVTFILSAICD